MARPMRSIVTPTESKRLISALLRRLRPVLMLLSSNAFATLVLAFGTFFVARIVNPAEFARYSLAAQIAVSVYPLLTLRYEHALPVVRRRSDSSLLLAGCLVLLPVTTLLLFAFGAIGASMPVIANYLPDVDIGLWLLITLGALSLASGSVFQSASLACGTLRHLAIARVLRALAVVAMQIGFVLSLDASATWLLIGEFSGNLLHALILSSACGFSAALVSVRRPWLRLWRRLFIIGKRYKEFPLITLPHAFTHSALGILFAVTLGAIYGASALGQYYLMRKLVFGVLAIFNVAVYQHAVSEAARVPESQLLSVSVRALLLMGGVGIVSAVAIALVGRELFTLVAGSNWSEAALMATASASLIVIEPVAATMAFLPIFLRLQHIAFAVAVLQGSVGIVLIAFSGLLGLDVINAIALSSLGVSVVMLSYVIWLLSRAKKIQSSWKAIENF